MIKKIRRSMKFGVLYDFVHPYRTVRRWVGQTWHVLRWVPILWHDRDWDWSCLMRIYEFKLRSMANSFDKYANHLGSNKCAKQMRVCAELCKRLHKNDYIGWRLEELYGDGGLVGDFDFVPSGKNASRMVYPNKRISDQEHHRLVLQNAKIEQRMQQQDIEYLFKLHRKYLHHWWD
jgi:hypothetical protein